MKKVLFIITVFISSLVAKPLVTVSIPPQEYIVEKIAGKSVDILVMVDPKANHETYEPKPAQMIQLSKASVYFTVGLPFEDVWMERFMATAPKMKIGHTDEDVTKLGMIAHSHNSDHEHDDEHDHDKEDMHSHNEHSHGTKDPHIWLDPILVQQQALVIAQTLSELYPENRDTYMENLGKFNGEMGELTGEIFKKLNRVENRDFLVFHPSWGYFAYRFKLNQIPIEVEGKEPKPAELIKIINIAKDKKIKTLFSEPQISQKSAELIAKEIDARVYVVDPLKKDIKENLLDFADKLSK